MTLFRAPLKPRGKTHYSIVSHDTVEQDFAMNRQLFLCEQGYEYHIVTLDSPRSILPPAPREP